MKIIFLSGSLHKGLKDMDMCYVTNHDRLIISNKFFINILQSRERLIRSLRAMNAGDAADQVIRQVDKMIKNGDRSTRAS